MTPDIETISDSDLNAAFAIEVAGWTRYDGNFEWDDDSGCPTVEGPEFATDANAIQPFLTGAFMVRAHFGKCQGIVPWHVEVQPDVSLPIFSASAATFARASALALLMAKRATISK